MSGEQTQGDRHAERLGRLAVVGTSFREVGFERLGELVLAHDGKGQEARRGLAKALGAAELVDVSTCNRVECYVASSGGPIDPEALRAAFVRYARGRDVSVDPASLRSVTGRPAVEHLFRVASGLESLVVGETEISGQVRRALDAAVAAGTAGPTLKDAFERALACSRRVRTAIERGAPPRSSAAHAVEKIHAHFGDVGPKVSVLVGVGPMTRKVGQALAGSPGERIFVNRTRQNAEPLAARFGGRAMSLEAFHRDPPPWIDLVFTATSAREAVILPEHLRPALEARRAAGADRPLIVCDLGVPRDVHPACDALEGCLVISLEHMQALAALKSGADDAGGVEAARIVAAEADRLEREARWQAIADESARAMLAARLTHLSEADREQILRFASGLATRFARQPGESD